MLKGEQYKNNIKRNKSLKEHTLGEKTSYHSVPLSYSRCWNNVAKISYYSVPFDYLDLTALTVANVRPLMSLKPYEVSEMVRILATCFCATQRNDSWGQSQKTNPKRRRDNEVTRFLMFPVLPKFLRFLPWANSVFSPCNFSSATCSCA